MSVFKTFAKIYTGCCSCKLRIGIEKLLFCIIVISCICSGYRIASSADPTMREKLQEKNATAKVPVSFTVKTG
jgi:hypothetical protein